MKPKFLDYAVKRSDFDPLTPKLRRATYIVVAALASPYIAFWIMLKVRHLRYVDFWGSGKITARPLAPRAIPLLGFAESVSLVALPSLCVLLVLSIFVCYRIKKRRAFEWTFDFAMVLICVFLTYEYAEIGAYLAGL